jgi:hypothetical protein
MSLRVRALAAAVAALLVLAGRAGLDAGPSVYPTGTTVYDPARAWSGYSVFVLPEAGAALIDMNGRVVRQWTTFEGASGGPVRVLPGGFAMGAVGRRPPHQESLGVALFDWVGTELWRFAGTEEVTLQDGTKVKSARQHHDWQRFDFPAGYFSPDASPRAEGGRTLVLSHRNVVNAAIHEQSLEDDRLLEVDGSGSVVWDWSANEHVDELGFSAAAREAIRGANINKARASVDWLHVNSATYVGPNRWFDAGDERFRPDHVLISSREANILAIVGRDGRVVWRMGPDYRESEATRALGQVIGQHHAHLIPKGLPGAGNLLVFDNGGAAGYGAPTPAAPNGVNVVSRGSSRVLEIDPVTFKKVWEYSLGGTESFRFFSHYVSSAQRLPNGNTFITEGASGRLFEVTTGGEIVWEYVSPFFTTGPNRTNRVYRAYRLPYAWVPQLERPVERAVRAPENAAFHVPLP